MKEEVLRVAETLPRERLTLDTRLDGVACTTYVYAVPVLLTLDAAVRAALVDRAAPLPALPDPIAAALAAHAARGRIRSAGVHRFALAGLVPLAGIYGNAYVTVRAGDDETIAVPDGPLPRRLPAPWILVLAFSVALILSYLTVHALR